MSRPPRDQTVARDRSVRAVRIVGRTTAVGATVLAAALSAVAASAFKGHSGGAVSTAQGSSAVRVANVGVPGPQNVPAISGAAAPLQAPAQPPAAVQQAAQAQVSGGS